MATVGDNTKREDFVRNCDGSHGIPLCLPSNDRPILFENLNIRLPQIETRDPMEDSLVNPRRPRARDVESFMLEELKFYDQIMPTGQSTLAAS